MADDPEPGEVKVENGQVTVWDPELKKWVPVDPVTPVRPNRRLDWENEA